MTPVATTTAATPTTWRVCTLLLLAFACGCGKSKPFATADGGADGGALGCLDQPGALPRPPDGGLPCELIPPGLRL